MKSVDVLIIGGGVAGLSAAAELRRLGVDRVSILEREHEAGGIPRHCGHWGFGLREFGWIMRGPDYAKRLADGIGGVDLKTGATVLTIFPGGIAEINEGAGIERLEAKAIILATGARETPRSPRLISGSRPPAVMNTGTLQQMVYLHGRAPFARPIIVGSELVSFSALVTLRHAGIRAIAMIEENRRIIARRPGEWVARLGFGVPVFLETRLLRILGDARVEAVEIDRGAGPQRLDCDGVILTGGFRPESALIAPSHLTLDPGTQGPSIDQAYRCSDPRYFAAGNVLRGIETAGLCWREGKSVARAIARHLDGKLPAPDRVPVATGGAIKYVYPQFLDRRMENHDPLLFKARAARATSGRLRLLADGKQIWSKRVSVLPERRIAWHVPPTLPRDVKSVEVRLDES